MSNPLQPLNERKPISFAVLKLRILRMNARQARFYQSFKAYLASDHQKYIPVASPKDPIFVHVPKVAGSSLVKALYGRSIGHSPLSFYSDIIPEKLYRECIKIGFVRDPVDRFLSAYNFLQAKGISNEDATFSRYLRAKYGSIDHLIEFGLKDPLIRTQKHFLPQSHYLTVNGSIGVNFLGRFETLSQDVAKLSRLINKEICLEHTNKTTTNFSVKRDMLTQKQIDAIKDLYIEDFRLLGY